MIIFWSCLIGSVSGILLGLGMGGGTLLIPLLLWLEVSQRGAQAAALWGFLPAAGLALYLLHKKGLVEWKRIFYALPFLIVGSVTGALTAGWLSGPWAQKGFGGLLTLMGILTLIQTIKKQKEKQ